MFSWELGITRSVASLWLVLFVDNINLLPSWITRGFSDILCPPWEELAFLMFSVSLSSLWCSASLKSKTLSTLVLRAVDITGWLSSLRQDLWAIGSLDRSDKTFFIRNSLIRLSSGSTQFMYNCISSNTSRATTLGRWRKPGGTDGASIGIIVSTKLLECCRWYRKGPLRLSLCVLKVFAFAFLQERAFLFLVR